MAVSLLETVELCLSTATPPDYCSRSIMSPEVFDKQIHTLFRGIHEAATILWGL